MTVCETGAVVQICRGGRGFIIRNDDDTCFIVTAAHCLPRSKYPRPHLGNGVSELTFPRVAGSLGAKHGTIWAELCVLNLTDDIAVLGAPDDQELSDKAEEFVEFTARPALQVGAAPSVVPVHKKGPGAAAFALSLDGVWMSCSVHNGGRLLTLSGVKVASGMSGSPILNADGAAIGLISTGSADYNLHPSLMDCLPPWLLRRREQR